MTCSDILTRLFDRYDRPALLLDANFRVLRVNEAAETSFGWPTTSVGTPLDELVTLQPAGGGTDWVNDVASLPQPSDCDAVAVTSTSHLVRLFAHLWHPDRGDRCYLLELEPERYTSTMPPPRMQLRSRRSSQEISFEIVTSDALFGIIRQADPLVRALRGWVGHHCYEMLFNRNTPCANCPISSEATPEPPSGIQVIFEAGGYDVVRYRASDANTARIKHRHLDEDLVRHLVGAHLQALAARAGLSNRERSVYELLVLGRSLDEIALVLGITPRTVRFHQSNLLEKLGADSRLDLLRLLL